MLFSQYDEDVGRATGSTEIHEDFMSNLSKISQLTGFSDPIYAEAYVKMHGFDIMLGKASLFVNEKRIVYASYYQTFSSSTKLQTLYRISVSISLL